MKVYKVVTRGRHGPQSYCPPAGAPIVLYWPKTPTYPIENKLWAWLTYEEAAHVLKLNEHLMALGVNPVEIWEAEADGEVAHVYPDWSCSHKGEPMPKPVLLADWITLIKQLA